VGAQDGGRGAVERGGLHVFVEVGRGYGADPVVAGLEVLAGAGA
jgi:hypothetical protein